MTEVADQETVQLAERSLVDRLDDLLLGGERLWHKLVAQPWEEKRGVGCELHSARVSSDQRSEGSSGAWRER